MATKIELRVHTGASTSRTDDDGYRAQAESYLQARYHASVSRSLKITVDDSRRIAGEDVTSSRLMGTNPNDANVIYDTTTFVEDTQLAYTALESQIVPCSQPARSSRALTGRTIEYTPVTSSRAPSITEGDEAPGTDSVESQSSYMKTPILNGYNKRRRIERVTGPLATLQRNQAPCITIKAQSKIGLAFLNSSSVSAAQNSIPITHKESHATYDITSELPSSYSLSDDMSGSSQSRPHASHRSRSDPGMNSVNASQPVIAARPSTSPQVPRSNDAAYIHGRPLEQRDILMAKTSPQAQPNTSSHMDVIPISQIRNINISGPPRISAREPPFEIADLPTAGQLHSKITSLPLSIQPPEPSVSVDEFTTHITPLLESLASLEVARAYKPVSVSRDVRVWERGHWLVNATSWKIDAQVNFWQKLQEYIGAGSCGWGVWCTRDCSETTAHRDPCLGIIRVFCWGEVVRHIYLLLYSISMSKVRLLGLQWLDAKEHVVVQMRGP